jgi:putative DNA primase/helicase
MKTLDAARGKWRGILLQMGIEREHLTGNHAPCPLCGGQDRFRFDNKNGNGSYICNQCGAGTGMQLLQRVKGWDFATAAAEVDKVLGNVQADQVKPAMDEERRKGLLRALWKASKPITADDLAGRYLASRGCHWCEDMRFVEQCPAPDGVKRPALIAMVRDAEGKPVNIHRTFLGENGKADMENPRAMMPGPVPDGSAIRLAPPSLNMGVCEGLETAYAAAARFGVPVWSAVDAGKLAKWIPPEGCKSVIVFGDNDANFTGQAAAYGLAHRLAIKGYAVRVEIPETICTDWADGAST